MTDLKPYLYLPNTDPLLDEDFSRAVRCHKLRAGETALFWKSFLRRYCVPYSRIQRIFRRILEAQGRLCCGGHHYLMEWLVLILDDGTEIEIYIGDDVGKDVAPLYQSLQEKHPQILFGKP